MRAAAVLVCLLGLEPVLAQPGLFTSASVNVGTGSGTVLLADINGDRHLDLLTRHLLTRVVAIQFGDGRGGFTKSHAGPLTFDYGPGDMALGDMNEDGRVDLVVTPGDRDIADVLLGTGTGDFRRGKGSPFMVTTNVEPYNKRTLQLLDLNEDGHLDIVTANGRRRNTFAVLFGDGRGGFAKGPEVPLDSGRDGYSFAFVDLNGDRHLDVVSASRAGYEDRNPGRAIVRLGDGRGGFSQSSRFAVPMGPRATMAADLDGDGDRDIAILNQAGALSVFLNDGKASLAPAPGSPFNLGIDSHFPTFTDVNGDGKLDLVAPTVKSVSVLLGDGRTFTPAPGSPFRAGPGAFHAGLGDVNGDGKPDIVAASFEGDAVTLLLRR